jgi:hypothetical protein
MVRISFNRLDDPAATLAILLQERAGDVADWLLDHGVDPAEMLMELPMVGELNWTVVKQARPDRRSAIGSAASVGMETMMTLPDKQKLREAFDQMVDKINQSRGSNQLTTPFYKAVGDTAFEASS